MTVQASYILGKYLDPAVAFLIGTSSYWLYERRLHRPSGHTLVELFGERYKVHHNDEQNIQKA